MKERLVRIIPKRIRTIVYDFFKNKVRNNNRIESNSIPKYEIRAELIVNTKLLTDRKELLRQLPKEGIVAELGVDEGVFSGAILKHSKPKKLHLIDSWRSKRYHQGKQKIVETKFKTQIDTGEVELNIGNSTDVVLNFKDHYFDWIYIDTDHSYQVTRDELEAWKPKVKENGIIAGHDYIIGNWDGLVRYGVIEAVYEFCIKNNWEIIYITMELDNHPSFAIKKTSVA